MDSFRNIQHYSLHKEQILMMSNKNRIENPKYSQVRCIFGEKDENPGEEVLLPANPSAHTHW